MDLHRRVPEPAVRDEIGRLARTMNAMLERLEASNEQQRQLIADVFSRTSQSFGLFAGPIRGCGGAPR